MDSLIEEFQTANSLDFQSSGLEDQILYQQSMNFDLMKRPFKKRYLINLRYFEKQNPGDSSKLSDKKSQFLTKEEQSKLSSKIIQEQLQTLQQKSMKQTKNTDYIPPLSIKQENISRNIIIYEPHKDITKEKRDKNKISDQIKQLNNLIIKKQLDLPKIKQEFSKSYSLRLLQQKYNNSLISEFSSQDDLYQRDSQNKKSSQREDNFLITNVPQNEISQDMVRLSSNDTIQLSEIDKNIAIQPKIIAKGIKSQRDQIYQGQESISEFMQSQQKNQLPQLYISAKNNTVPHGQILDKSSHLKQIYNKEFDYKNHEFKNSHQVKKYMNVNLNALKVYLVDYKPLFQDLI